MPGKENGKRRGVIRLNAGRYDPIKSALGWGKQEKGKVKRGKAGKREKGTEDTEDAEDEEREDDESEEDGEREKEGERVVNEIDESNETEE